jgi:hypothetical protein
MTMKTAELHLGTLVAILFLSAPAHAQIITNGSFETLQGGQTDTTQYVEPFNGSTFPTNGIVGWTLLPSVGNSFDGLLTSGNFDLGGVAESGTNAVFLQGTGAASQTISLNAPGQYTLSYYQEGRILSSPDANSVIATITGTEGTLLSYTSTPTNTADTSSSNYQLVTQSFTVTTADTYTLTLAGGIPFGSGDYTSFVDNVSVQATPEPPTYVLVGAGALVLFLLQRRRHLSCRAQVA